MERSKTLPRNENILSTRENFNRGYDTTRTDDKDKLISVGLMDIDAAVMYYFNEVIKPVVVDNNEKVKVPVYYANPERWKSIQKLGYLRDVKGQLVTPLIIFKRTSFTKDTNNTFLARSISPASSNYTFLKKHTKENRFTQTSTLSSNDEPLQEAHNVVMPSYVTVNYNCIAFTPYIDQMNQIVEKISWSRKSYWGEPDKFKFKAGITSFTDASEFEGERIIKNTFDLSIKGYLVPYSFDNIVNTQKEYSDRIGLELGVE
jgi:hypothetical protein